MLKEFNYSYLVRMAPTASQRGKMIQVNCYELVMEPRGGITFWGKDRKYIVCAFPAGAWTDVEVMSQADGLGNGYETLRT